MKRHLWNQWFFFFVCAKIDSFSQISDTSEHIWRISVWIASILRSINHVESATWWASRFTPLFIPLNSSNRLFTVLSCNFDHIFCVSYRFAYSPFVWNDYFHFCLQCRRDEYLCGMVCGFMIVGTITTKKNTSISDYWTWRKGEREKEIKKGNETKNRYYVLLRRLHHVEGIVLGTSFHLLCTHWISLNLYHKVVMEW